MEMWCSGGGINCSDKEVVWDSEVLQSRMMSHGFVDKELWGGMQDHGERSEWDIEAWRMIRGTQTNCI